MHSQAKNEWYQTPRSTRIRKELYPNLRPEKQQVMPKKGITEKPHIGQGRSRIEKKA